MRLFLTCCTLSMLLLSAHAQTRRRPGQPVPIPAPARVARKLVETVKTQDGREVHLYDDMTYDVAAAPPAPTTVEISVKAGVVTNGGDLKNVARREFIVFKEDIKPLISSIKNREGKNLAEIFDFYLVDKYRELEGQAYLAAIERIKPAIAGTFTTDFEGSARIQLPASETPYYIYGSFDVGRSSCMWYLPFVPNKNGNLALDNENAAYCH